MLDARHDVTPLWSFDVQTSCFRRRELASLVASQTQQRELSRSNVRSTWQRVLSDERVCRRRVRRGHAPRGQHRVVRGGSQCDEFEVDRGRHGTVRFAGRHSIACRSNDTPSQAFIGSSDVGVRVFAVSLQLN
jgi:hypothetical protein